MKKILSMLLCVMLLMSSMATVAFADEAAAPATITFGNYMAQLPAGSRIIVNTGDVAEGNTVVANINGVESAVAYADGCYAVTVPAGDNLISVAVKDGDTVVAKTATINVFGLSYLGEGTVAQNATFEIDSTNLIGNKLGFYDVGMNPNWYNNITNHLAVSKTDEADAYVQGYIWGTAASDPNNAEGYTKRVNGGNTAYASAQRNFRTITKFSIDYRFDKIDEINPEDGTVVRSLPMRNPDEIKIARNADSDHNGSASFADCTMLTVQYIYDDIHDYDNDNNSTEEIRSGFGYWYLDSVAGKPVFRAYDDNGNAVTFPVSNFNEGWNTYSVIVDLPNDMVYGYINDIYVGSGHLAFVTLTRPEGDPDKGKKALVEPKEAVWPTIGGMRVYNSSDAVAYYSIDNYDITSYAGFASTEPEMQVTNNTLNATQPAGAKANISAIAANIPANGGIVAVVNGVKVPLTYANGKYTYDGAFEAGYNNIYVAMVDAKGNIVKNSAGTEMKSAEWTYYAFGSAGDDEQIQGIYPELNFPTWAEVDAMSNADKNALSSAFYTAGYNGYNEYYDLTDYAARKGKTAGTNKLVVNGTDDKYFSITSWGSYYADPIYTTNPDAARKDGSGSIFTSSKRSGDTGSAVVDRYWDISVDYKVDSVDQLVVGTGELVRTVNIDSADALKGVWHWAEWNIMDNQYVFDSNYNSKRTAKTLFGFDKTTGKPFARTYDANNNPINTIVDVNPGEWHNYRAIVDIEEDCVYLLVDNVLVAQGALGTYNASTTDITEVLWPHVCTGRQYAADTPSTSGNWVYHERMHASFDDWTIRTYNAMDADTSAIVNAAITADGASLAIVPANLGLADDVAIDIAVVAKTAAGAVKIQKYEDVTNASAYKAFAFDTAGIQQIFVWDWETLEPIVDVID